MNKPKKQDSAPKKAPKRRERPKGPNMEKFSAKIATMNPFIFARKLAQLTKHDKKNWSGQ